MKKFVVFMLALLFILPINNVHAQREVTISLDGKTITADAKPYIKNDRTMVPIRLISESLGYKVNWDEANRQVKVEKADKSLLITIDKKEYLLNGEKKQSDVAAEITKDRTFVPIRLIAESLGEDVGWDPDTYTVIIKSASNLDAEAKQLEDIAKGFQKNISELRSYYFENASKYTQDQQIVKLEEVKANINSLIAQIEGLNVSDKYQDSLKYLKEYAQVTKNILNNYNEALIEGNEAASKKLVDYQTQLAIKLKEFTSALEAESKGQKYQEEKDIKAYKEAGDKDSLLEDESLKNLFNKL
ncbi:copper amine oxidase N-terminal domain-containing protein [Peptoniphilus obesi]|uniref:copper amine oxidase N-terminal domain-containing protein n=1 Tax=Peptoniphilus obesi TaxID=1472765 RepID=UPI0004AD071C|nr:copper amine oxidase N-terminal domain-containing protein [Peptoniphilus obesi]